jgi:S1/P1 Nuclease
VVDHLVGDVHQPLHAVARFTHDNTDGDAGGNDIALNCPGNLSCEDVLHAEWDHVLGDGASFNGIKSAATSLDAGPAPTGAGITDVGAWIQESVTLAKSHVYKTTSGGRLGPPQATLTQGCRNVEPAYSECRGEGVHWAPCPVLTVRCCIQSRASR